MRRPVRTMSIWSLVLLAPYVLGFTLDTLATSTCSDPTCRSSTIGNIGNAVFLTAILTIFCAGPIALLGLVTGIWAFVLSITQARQGKQARWLATLFVTGFGVSIATLASVALAALNANANTPAAVQGASEVYAESAAIGALALLPCLALPMVIVTLLYGIFGAPVVELPRSEQRSDSEASLTPAAMRDIETFRLQVEAQLSTTARDSLHLSFDEGAPVAAQFAVDEGRRGKFSCEKVGAYSGVCTTWLVNFPDGQQTSIPAREDTLLEAIRAWRAPTA